MSISIILLGVQGQVNIGAAARAMKNFGLRDLRLVGCSIRLTGMARRFAVDARDLLKGAARFATLEEALADTNLAVTFTRRIGRFRRLRMTAREAAAWIGEKSAAGNVALLFGREDRGLSNEEVRQCDAIVTIPSSSALPSLNVAQALLIACYELFVAGGSRQSPSRRRRSAPAPAPMELFAPRREVAHVLKRIEEALTALGYDDLPPDLLRSKILFQLRRLFGRAGLTPRDVGMFKGLSARIVDNTGNRPERA